jgi:TatD DNase family protein
MLVDTHCHLFFPQYDADLGEVLGRARRSGVRAFVNVGIDEPTSRKALELAEREPDVYATVGLHPHSAGAADEAAFGRLEALARASRRIVAVGEVGLDYAKASAGPDVQRKVFLRMAELAGAAGLPLIVHSREALDDTLAVLAEAAGRTRVRAVFHCFSYGRAALDRVLAAGFSVSFTGIVTFPNAPDVKASAQAVPDDRFMLETDSPYLAPQAARGKRNEPAFIAHVASEIAALRKTDSGALGRRTSENAAAFFGLDRSRWGGEGP